VTVLLLQMKCAIEGCFAITNNTPYALLKLTDLFIPDVYMQVNINFCPIIYFSCHLPTSNEWPRVRGGNWEFAESTPTQVKMAYTIKMI
jgi:hypothetical protein